MSDRIWQVFARADPAAGSTINEYKSSLQLPGSHLSIHLAATHLLVIKHCLMHLWKINFQEVRGQSGLQAQRLGCFVLNLYTATATQSKRMKGTLSDSTTCQFVVTGCTNVPMPTTAGTFTWSTNVLLTKFQKDSFNGQCIKHRKTLVCGKTGPPQRTFL